MIKLISLIALLTLLSCSKPHYGCTKREQRKSAKHFNKSVNWCANEAMRQSLVHFPMKESDSTFSKVEILTDTFTNYDTLVINDTVYITKTVDKIVNKVTTNTKEVRVEDSRKVGILQNEIANAKQEKTDLAVKLAKENAAKKIWRNLFIGLATFLALVFGIKFIIPKVLNRL